MQNTQAPEKISYTNEHTLDVHSTFLTIQGEGPYSGRVAFFIRLAGCNLQCPGCDTKYTEGRRILHVTELLDATCFAFRHYEPLTNRNAKRLVVITGGEPFRQNVSQLVKALIERLDCEVQIETNGTLPPSPNLSPYCDIVCSPKTSTVNKKLIPRITAYKYVLNYNSVDDADGLPILALGHSNAGKVARPHNGFFGPVYIQPEDVGEKLQNELNTVCCRASAMKFGYTLQLQIHKLLGLE